jgi:hypothetical protein
MTQIKQINTGVCDLLFVMVPEKSFDFSTERRSGNRMHLTFLQKKDLYPAGFIEIFDTIELNKGDYQLLGVAYELDEEECEVLVVPRSIGDEQMCFLDYEMKDFDKHQEHQIGYSKYSFTSAKRSFKSFLKVNEIYSENPHGVYELVGPAPIEDYNPTAQLIYKCWQKAQQNVGKWIVLKKLN